MQVILVCTIIFKNQWGGYVMVSPLFQTSEWLGRRLCDSSPVYSFRHSFYNANAGAIA